MRRYLLKLSYIGTHYRGSQKQANGCIADIDSIQGAIESSMRRLSIANIPNLVLAGRTDAGVHALNTTAHVDLDHKLGDQPFDTDNMVRMMNRNLINSGHNIRIFSAHQVSKDFHARYSAKSRSYLYRLLIAKNPLDHRVPISEHTRALHVNYEKIDIDKMRKGVELFRGKKNFMTFSSKTKHRDVTFEKKETYVKTLSLTMEEGQPMMPCDQLSQNFMYWHLIFESKSFLYNQIRRIVGTLLALGLGKISEEDIMTMLQVPSHYNWNPCILMAHPHGLYLTNVEYDEADVKEIHS